MIAQRSPAEWRQFLRRNGIRPSKSMGQNFLTETSVVREIVRIAGVQPGLLVIEIGPGLGILTRELLAAGADVIAVELDQDLAALLRQDLADAPGFSLIEQDARDLDTQAITGGRPFHVVANLPYSVAMVILRHLMEAEHPPTQMTVMVQTEVAQRMTAQPGDLSLLGIATDLYAEASIALEIPPEVFEPAPKVNSSVVDMRVRPALRGTEATRERMFALATMAFQRKRKTLANGLSLGLELPKAEVEAALTRAGVKPDRRPQTVSVDEWLAIARALPA